MITKYNTDELVLALSIIDNKIEKIFKEIKELEILKEIRIDINNELIRRGGV